MPGGRGKEAGGWMLHGDRVGVDFCQPMFFFQFFFCRYFFFPPLVSPYPLTPSSALSLSLSPPPPSLPSTPSSNWLSPVFCRFLYGGG